MGKKNCSTSTPPLDGLTEDGILCSIISWLPLREAVRSCVLSPRWRHIWTHLPDLRFDGVSMFGPEARYYTKWLESRTDEFIASVNSVLQQRHDQGNTRIRKLWIRFVLNKSHSLHIDAWVRCGVESKTSLFVLDLGKPFLSSPRATTSPIEPYDFPCHLLEGPSSSSIKCLNLTFCSLRTPHGFDGLTSLRNLILDRVDTTEEDIERLLSNCFTLNFLLLERCQQLAALRISHPLTDLKTVQVHDCDKLRKIEIHARNLVGLAYTGPWIDFDAFRGSSQLVEAHLHFKTDENVDLTCALAKLSINMPLLENLRFRISGVSKVAEDLPNDSISLSYLTHFDWIVDGKTTLVCLASLLNSAPLLEKFGLECKTRAAEEPPQLLSELRRLPEQRPHNHLKTVKISGFYGDKWQIEIALYLLENAIELESMKIEKGLNSFEKIHEDAIEGLCQEAVLVNVNLVIL